MRRFTPALLSRQLQSFPATAPFCVAYSGGLDSHVLLHALHSLRRELGAELRAVHVDHRLHPDSHTWARHCEAVCRDLDVPVTVLTVEAAAGPGESPEAAAREARYAALREHLQPGETLLTAHQLDDQAETVLLQLLRGAGPAGLASMAPWRFFGPGSLARPLLAFTREVLDAYAREQGLSWLEDPSNADPHYDRNFLRHEVLPRLAERWPSFAATLGRAARHQAEADELLNELAAVDLQTAALGTDRLSITALEALSPARQRNLLRRWIRSLGLSVPDHRQLEAIRLEAAGARADAAPRVAWPGGEVRRYRKALYALPEAPSAACSEVYVWEDTSRPLAIPGLGRVQMEPAETGLAPDALLQTEVSIRFRHGGEQCRLPGRGTRPLKDLFQECGIPPWQRGRIPLLYVGDALAAVVGHCICEPFAAPLGQTAVRPRLFLEK